MDLESIKKQKAENLKDIADELLKLGPLEEKLFVFNTSDLTSEHIPNKLIQSISDWEKSDPSLFVYYFLLHENTDVDHVYQKVKSAKTEKIANRAYPRINYPSRYLYVGSSRELAKRFKAHLGYSYIGTYAMQLLYWCSDLNIDVDFFCMRFSKNTKPEILQSFEDGFWDAAKPMLGRKGAR